MTKTIREKNHELETKLISLRSVLPHTDIVGYAAARNARIIGDSLTEYFNISNEIMRKYGKEETDEEGKPTGRVSIAKDNPHYDDAVKEINNIRNIENEVTLMTIKYDEVVGILSGEEILNIDWMLED